MPEDEKLAAHSPHLLNKYKSVFVKHWCVLDLPSDLSFRGMKDYTHLTTVQNIMSTLTLLQIMASEPGVPGRVHSAQVVQTVRCSHQGVDFTLPALKLGQVVEAGHDGCDGLLDQRHQLLGVHVLRLAGWGQGHGRVLLGFLVPGNNLIPQNCLEDAIHLSGAANR